MQVKTELDLMYSVINMLSDHSFDIIEAIGKCSSLVDFLKETVDEDIRNLIDAVEDISEQQVRESTVSGLIEIKQMLLPLLKGESGESCKEILCQVEQQITKTSKTTSIPVKIHECMDNLHNLKFLYHNVANRGEQTKQIVKNICEHGVFRFFLDERPGCVLVEARYEQNESIVRKNISELTDLRSRSLLLMNKESSIDNLSREQVENFVEYIDLSIDVADLYTLLHTSGHFKYMAINNEELLPGDLALTRRKLDEELEEWQKELSEERKKHYFMNFIHGFRLHSMFQYLNMNDDVANEDKENLEDTVNSILVFVHQNMKARELRKHYLEKREKCKFWTNKEWLNCLGTALHAAYSSSFTDLEKDILCKDKNDTLKITDVVEEGKLFVSQLDERSPYTVRTVLALYANTVNRMPMPHQVLFCTPETTLDEIELLIERCLGAKSFYGCKSLYCIANVELLPSELHFDLLDMLRDLQERHRQFLLALVCRGTNSNPIINELSEFTTTLAPATENFVRSVFTEQYGDIITFTSEVAGLGKSCKIFKDAQRKQKAVKILHVSGCARKGHIIERLRSLKVRSYHVLHIDIGTVDNPKSLDTLLFELLILGYASAGRECVALKTNYVYIEIANTINETLKNSLPTTMLFSREHIQWQKFDDFVVSKEVNSSVQMSCKYFDYLEKGYLDRRDLNMNEKNPLSTKKCRRLLKTFLNTEDDMSFPVVNATLDVLADQFKKMSCSPFFKISRLRDMIGNRKEQTVKSSLVKEIIKSAKEFASRSVGSCRATQTSTILPDAENLSNDLSKPSDTAESVTERIKGMIRWEDSNHLMFVFHCQNIQTLSPLYRDRNKVPDNIKTLFQSQMNKQLQDFRSFNQAQLQDFIQKIARDNPLPLDGKTLSQMASEYALTPDNLLKMVLIMLRVKANVPVVIMGETGCGKTSLVRYLASICEVQFDVMNIHAGVSEREIIDKVYKNCRLSYDKLNLERWLFLDEINTSESIGVMNEIICHRKCLGVSLPPNLIVMGACNPYKLRSKKSIETAGLTLKSKHDELSRLVYRVLPLPEIMVDYVWDFGSLNENDEKCYIYRMVDGLFDDEKLQSLFSELLSVSQVFVRQKEASEYVVSLRDVYRCKLLTRWFMEVLKKKTPLNTYSFKCNLHIRAMVLALAHCYHSRFQNKGLRADYRNVLRAKLKEREISGFEVNQDKVACIINEEQKDFLMRMELPAGTACNTALMENVFVIFVCIYNRLPVFVVGKPGCSKSLAMQVIRSNLRGKDSKDTFFKTLPQLYCVSFQGSESSTSNGITKVFEKAEKYQLSNNPDDVMSVVILDEIGLAEVSRFNPLKVLHNLLEPDGEMRPHVAVVGLSNWSLDASKMNRAIHLSRTDMDAEELYETAKAISESLVSKNKTETFSLEASILNAIESQEENKYTEEAIDLNEALNGISVSFYTYSQRLRFKNFHGLRDYYSLVKYVVRTFAIRNKSASSVQQTREQSRLEFCTIVKSGLDRNFGGLPSESLTLYETFEQNFHFHTRERENVLDLITANIEDPMARHLMLITSGDSALGILEQQLNKTVRSKKEIIFGSQFEDDLTDEYYYRILSRIILCMEEGITLILKDLDNIYGSLYDVLNQNYTVIGNKKNCRVALGAYSNPICQVADSFRCIVLMDESKLENCDPPFLNRFEKQYLRFSDTLNSEQIQIVQHLQAWIKDLRDIQDRLYDYTDVLAIYSNDLLPSLVMKLGREYDTSVEGQLSFLLSACKNHLMWILKPEAVIRLKNAVSSKMSVEADEIAEVYFDLPLHRGLDDLISFQLSSICCKPEQEGILTIVFTKSNMYINLHDCISRTNVQIEKISAFKSEKQVSARIRQFWSKETAANILLIQCSAVEDEKHIMLTKSIIERHRTLYREECGGVKHVYLIIHMPSVKGGPRVVFQINFMSDWNLVMLDSLECPQTELPQLCKMDILEAIDNKRPLEKCLTSLLFWSFTRIKYATLGRDIISIQTILAKLKGSADFLHFLDEEIWRTISETGTHERNWQIKVACDIEALRNSSSFVDALEQHIIQVIKIPLSKLIFGMEENGILDSYFMEDVVCDKRKQVWLTLLRNDKLFSLANTPEETGPECYSCETADCSLRMPFSKIIFTLIEAQKEEFIDELSVLKGHFEVDRNEDLPMDVYNALLEKQEQLILLKIPEWELFQYKTCEKDYIHDFSSMMSVNLCSGMTKERRAYIMEWIISQKSDLSSISMLIECVRLHISVWMNNALFRSEMQLLDVCEKIGLDVTEELQNQSGDVSGRSSAISQHENEDIIEQAQVLCSEDYLVENICKMMIPIESTIQRYRGVHTWQRTVNAVLAFAAKVSIESNSLYSLRVCNEIASDIIIPLHLKADVIYPLGELLLSETVQLDSEEVFSKVVDVISAGLNKDTSFETNCYRVFSSYLVRCISIYPETTILELFFSYVINNAIPDEMKHHFRKPLYIAIDLENDEDFIQTLLKKSDKTETIDAKIKNGVKGAVVDIKGKDKENPKIVYYVESNETEENGHKVKENATRREKKKAKEEDKGENEEDVNKYEVKGENENAEKSKEDQVVKGNEKYRPKKNNEIGNDVVEIKPAGQKAIKSEEAEIGRKGRDSGEGEEKHEEQERQATNESDNISEGSVFSETVEEKSLADILDSFLQNLAERNRQDDPFVLLLVDMLQDQFESTLLSDVFKKDSPDRFSTLFDCHKILLDGKFGLQFLSALSYVKSFITLLGNQNMWDYEKNREYWNKVNVILSDVKPHHISTSLLIHFIKNISKGLTIPQLKIKIESKKDNHDFLEKISWTADYPHFSFDGNPFCLLLNDGEPKRHEVCNFDHKFLKAITDEKLKSVVSNCKCNPQELQRLLSFVLNEFQLTKTSETVNKQTITDAFARLVQELEDDKLSWVFVLKCLCGAEDFKHQLFDLESNSRYLNYNLQGVFLQTFILLLSHSVYDEKPDRFVFMKCLKSPLATKSYILPGFLDSVLKIVIGDNSSAKLVTCKCGSRIAFFLEETENKDGMKCVFCSEMLADEKLVCERIVKDVEERVTLWGFENIPTDQIRIKGLHPFTIHFLQLITKGCILGSLAFGFTTIEEVKTLVGDEFSIKYLLEDIKKHWNHLCKQLCLDDCSLSNLVRILLLETRQLLTECHAGLCTQKLRAKIENDFEEQFKQLLLQRSHVVKSKIVQHNKLHGVTDSSFESQLLEVNDIDHLSEQRDTLPFLFRLKSYPTQDNFISELGWNDSEFPFLCLLLENEKELCLPQQLHSIIQWHITAVGNINYMLKKHECLEMTVNEFIFFNKKKKNTAKKRFDAFKNAWDELISSLKNSEFGSTMKHIHTATKLKDCLMYNQETVMYKVLERLVLIHNQFLDKTLLIANKSEALHFLAVKENVYVFPCVQITEIKKEDLVHFECDNDAWGKILKENSLSRLEYGCGSESIYDFQAIEKIMAMKVLAGKSYIDFRHSIPNIIFVDELYINYADLLSEIKQIIKQKPLTQEIIDSIQAKKNDDPKNVKDLLSHLGTLMTLLKKTGGDAEEPLVHYVSKWSNILSHEFPRALLPNPETSVKLSHVIGLCELLEEICSENVIDALEKEYTDTLDDVAKKHISELLCDLPIAVLLLKALKRFMYRAIFSQTADPERPVCGYLSDNSFWSDGCKEKNIIKIDEKEESLHSLLPDYLMVRHVQSFVKEMEKEIENKEKESLRLSEMVTDFKKAPEKKKPQNKATLKKARARKFREY